MRNIIGPLDTFVQVDIPYANAGGRVFDAGPAGALDLGWGGGGMYGGYIESCVWGLRPDRRGSPNCDREQNYSRLPCHGGLDSAAMALVPAWKQ